MTSGARPLANGQRLLWTGQQLHPDAVLLNMAFAFRIRGPLDPRAFEAAFRSVVHRSDALRTVIEAEDGVPSQRVLPPEASGAMSTVEHVDVSAEADPDAAYRRWAEARVRQPFDLAERMVDSALVRLAPEDHVWMLHQHHVGTDASSIANVYAAVSDAYGRAVAGTLDDAPDLPAFADFLTYEERFRASPLFERARQHWADQLPLAPPPRLYGSHETTPTAEAGRVTRTLSRERSDRLRALARGDGALTEHLGVFNRLSALFFAFLHRASGQSQVAYGAAAHNRQSAAFRETIGMFMETFPVQVEIEEGETFATLLAKAQRETGGFLRYAHPGTSTAEGHRGLRAMFSYVPTHFGDFAGLAAETEWIHSGHGDSHHHVRLQAFDFDASGEITFALDLNASVFDAELREAAGDHFIVLLDAMLEDETQPLATVPLLSDAERERVLGFATEPGAANAPETLLHGLWRQVQATPEAIALQQDRRTWTYEHLWRRITDLAGHLRARGVGPGMRVVIEMERTAEAVLAMLATLRAGAAYVPVDLDAPSERRDAIVREVDPALTLTEDLLSQWTDPPEASGDALPLPGSGDLAYVIYTSGSTGQPKGVMIEHGALAAYAAWTTARYAAGQPLDMALCSPLSFDLSVTAFVVPLLSGGRIRVYPDPRDGSPVIVRVMNDDAVDALRLTPSHLALLEGRRPARRIRTLVSGGEALSTAHAQLAASLLAPGARVFNEYGPTEATVGCTTHLYDPSTDTGTAVPIGRPGGHEDLYVLDPAMKPVPVGVIGEIYIGGPGLARGYFDAPDLTGERFLPHPFKAAPHRVYRTGDLGLWRPDGTLECLGRTDNQVKVNGVRVELGDVEAALMAVPGVTHAAAVVASGDAAPAGTSLIGYYASPEAIPADRLRASLRSRLPRAVLPSVFVHMDAMPTTPNGKIDRSALPLPEIERPELTIAYAAPRTDAERALVSIWQDVLHLQRIGIDDNFFDLGGDSILAMQITSRANGAGFSLSPGQLFAHQTVAELAAASGEATTRQRPYEAAAPMMDLSADALGTIADLLRKADARG